eukprot:2816141-Amphidinium_carterae.1
MKGKPDPGRLYQALQTLTTELARQNPVFASDLSMVIRENRVRVERNEETIMEYVRRLEQELSQRMSDEGGNNLNHASGME